MQCSLFDGCAGCMHAAAIARRSGGGIDNVCMCMCHKGGQGSAPYIPRRTSSRACAGPKRRTAGRDAAAPRAWLLAPRVPEPAPQKPRRTQGGASACAPTGKPAVNQKGDGIAGQQRAHPSRTPPRAAEGSPMGLQMPRQMAQGPRAKPRACVGPVGRDGPLGVRACCPPSSGSPGAPDLLAHLPNTGEVGAVPPRGPAGETQTGRPVHTCTPARATRSRPAHEGGTHSFACAALAGLPIIACFRPVISRQTQKCFQLEGPAAVARRAPAVIWKPRVCFPASHSGLRASPRARRRGCPADRPHTSNLLQSRERACHRLVRPLPDKVRTQLGARESANLKPPPHTYRTRLRHQTGSAISAPAKATAGHPRRERA